MKKTLVIVTIALVISTCANIYQYIVLINIARENIVSVSNVDHMVIGEEHSGDTTAFINLINEPSPLSVIAIRNGITLPHSKFHVKGHTVTVEGNVFESDIFQFNYLIKN